MIESQYIKDILNLVLDSDDVEEIVRKQIVFLNVKKREHTGVGLFVYFEINEPNLLIKEKPNRVLNGIRIFSEKEKIEAEANLFIKDGYIDYLEILSFIDTYPINDPISYTIKQDWPNSRNRIIVRE